MSELKPAGFADQITRLILAARDRSAPRLLWAILFGKFENLDALDVKVTSLAKPYEASECRVPAIIFQTWKSKSDLPNNYAYWRSTFVLHNPAYEFVLWDDADNRHFIETRHPWFLEIYDAYPREIFRADIIRFFFLFEFGGVYADLDSECLRPLHDLRLNDGISVGRMGLDEDFDHSIPNAIMASEPNQLFWILAISLSIEKFKEWIAVGSPVTIGPEEMTGPIILKRAVDFYMSNDETAVLLRCREISGHFMSPKVKYGRINLLEPGVFYGIDWTNPIHRHFRSKMLRKKSVINQKLAKKLFPDSPLVTYWSHSW